MKKLLGNYRDRFFDCINNTSINLYEKIRNYTIRTKKVTVQVRRMLQFWILNFMKVKLEKKKDPNPVSITARNAHNNRNSVFQAKWRFKLKEKNMDAFPFERMRVSIKRQMYISSTNDLLSARIIGRLKKSSNIARNSIILAENGCWTVTDFSKIHYFSAGEAERKIPRTPLDN